MVLYNRKTINYQNDSLKGIIKSTERKRDKNHNKSTVTALGLLK